ncbi:MAG: LytTR family DNA-binding domain-containing protein [Gammaproteobacteria bacterium]
MTSWKLIELLGITSTFGYFLIHALVPWLLSALLTAGWMGLFARWRPHPLILAALGGVTASVLILPFANTFAHTLPAIALELSGASADGFTGTLAAFLRAFLLWMTANFVVDRYLGYQPWRYARTTMPDGNPLPVTTNSNTQVQPAFLNRLSRPIATEDLLALKAEQHYVKVIGKSGNELVLYRLSDAVHELPDDLGQQVHRSWWVSNRAVLECRQDGSRTLTLCLKNGVEVPVSAPYQAMTRRWLTSLSISPAANSSAENQAVQNRRGQQNTKLRD